MKRIAFVAHLSEVSGAGVALLETVAGFSGSYKTWLVLPGEGPLADRARARGIECVVIANPEVALLDSAIGQKLRVVAARGGYIRRLKAFLRAHQVDLVYVNSSVSVFPGVAARMAGKPIAWHIHETLDAPDRRTRWKKRIISRLADGLIYASQSGMKYLPPPPGTPAMVARNFVPLDRFTEAARAHGEQAVPGDVPVVLMNGTFHRKAADILLKSLQLLSRNTPELRPRTEIAGAANPSDTYYFELTQMADVPDLRGRVDFTGLQSSLVEPLSRASVFVSASRNEALPISIVEAMASRVPVISTDVGDCADLLEYGKCGWVIPPESPEALAAALQEVLTQPDLVDAKTHHAYDKVSKLYHAENFWEPLEKFLVNLVERRRRTH